MLQSSLECRGYEVIAAASGEEALRLAYHHHPDLILLDIMMSGMDGFETCRRLREMTDAPIIMLTAKGTEEDVLRGFHAGADDYVVKPFYLKELEARMSAIMKRTGVRDWEQHYYSDGFLKIDLDCQEVTLDGVPVHLTPTEFRLLQTLVENKGTVVSHDELLRQVWGKAYKSATVMLSVYISYLRDKLGENSSNPRYIHTRWGVGYLFAPRDL